MKGTEGFARARRSALLNVLQIILPVGGSKVCKIMDRHTSRWLSAKTCQYKAPWNKWPEAAAAAGGGKHCCLLHKKSIFIKAERHRTRCYQVMLKRKVCLKQ